MNPKTLLWMAALVALAPLNLFSAEPVRNVVVLLVDDWGWTDGGVFGSDLYETPNIDELAAQGIRFTDAYAACTVCSPTRAALMTGLYPARLRVTDWISGHSKRYQNPPLLEPDWTQKLEHDQTTLAEVLREHGFRTANVGKWHLTPDVEPGSEGERAYWPEHHGFEVNIAGNQYGKPGSYFAPFSRGARQMFNMPDAAEGEHLTDRLTDEAIRLIQQWKDERFFLYLPYYMVHTPIQEEPGRIAKYGSRIRDDMLHTNAAYAAMVERLDDSVGHILQALDELGLSDNTLIVLTGDNGGLDPNDTGRITNNAPLRDGKGSVYEGGVRVPCVIRIPGGVEGGVTAQPMITNDLFPTLLAATGLDPFQHPSDGLNLTPLLRGESDSLPERDLFWHYPHYHTQGATPYSAIRRGDFRLIEYHVDGNVELYNLSEDIGERVELSRKLPHVTAQLRATLHEWRKSVQAQMPQVNPDYDPTLPTYR